MLRRSGGSWSATVCALYLPALLRGDLPQAAKDLFFAASCTVRCTTTPAFEERRAAARLPLGRHGRACPGHPRLAELHCVKTWMPATSAGMTIESLCLLRHAGLVRVFQRGNPLSRHGRTCSGHPRLATLQLGKT